jgi:MFS family permease
MKAVVETSDIRRDSATSPDPASARLPKTIVRLGWVSFLTDVSSEMIVPVLPAFLATLPGAPAVALGWIEGVAETTASLVKVVSGRITDRSHSKKPLVLFGYGVSSIARPLIALARVWPVVLVIRFLDRIGKGVRSAPRDTLIAAIAPPEKRGAAFGLHRAFDNAGAVLGPLIASALMLGLGFEIRTVFALAAVPGLMSLAVLAFGVKEEKATDAAVRPRAPGTDDAPLPRSFWRAAVPMTLFALASSSDTFLLLKAKEVGVPAAYLPILWSFGNAVRAGLSRVGGGLSDRFGRRPLLLSAWVLYAACYAAFAFVAAPLPLVVVFGIYSLYAAMSEGAERALVADLVGPHARGRAFGWLHGLLGFAALPASALFGFAWQAFGSKAAFLAGATVAALAAVTLLALVPRRAAAPR